MKLEIGNWKLDRGKRATCYALLVVCVMLFSASLCPAAEPYSTNYTFTAGFEGWTNGYTGATLSNPGGYIRLAFGAQSKMPMTEMDFAGVQVTPGVVPTNVQFSFNNEVMPAGGVWLAFHSIASGSMWMRTISAPDTAVWTNQNIDVSFTDGWAAGAMTTEARFNAAVQTIDWIGVYVRRNGSVNPQSYGIDDFVMTGYIGPPPAVPVDTDGDGMTDLWEVAHGFDPDNPGDAGVDYDGDGMSNFAEYLSGTDPNDPGSTFGVEASPSNRLDSVEGFILEWSSVSNRTYDVLRTDNFFAGFNVLTSGVIANPPKNTYTDKTATNAESFFYRIRATK